MTGRENFSADKMSFLQKYFVYFKKANEIRRKIIRSDADSYLFSGYLGGKTPYRFKISPALCPQVRLIGHADRR